MIGDSLAEEAAAQVAGENIRDEKGAPSLAYMGCAETRCCRPRKLVAYLPHLRKVVSSDIREPAGQMGGRVAPYFRRVCQVQVDETALQLSGFPQPEELRPGPHADNQANNWAAILTFREREL